MFKFDETYEIDKCVHWIKSNSYEKVCLQFPNELLQDCVQITLNIEKRINQKVFVLCLNSFDSCCVDYNSAKHINADAIIHFGKACLSPCTVVPTLYVLPKESLEISSFVNCVYNLSQEVNLRKLVLLYDVAFLYLADEILEKLNFLHDKVCVSHLMVHDHQAIDSTLLNAAASSQCKVIKKFGRIYCVPSEVENDQVLYIYITSQCSRRKNFENFLLSLPDSLFYNYNNSSNTLMKEEIPITRIKRKLFEIEKLKEANNIGILVATVSVNALLEGVARIKYLCKMKRKKCYVISVGKPSAVKLANFPEIDVFVMLSCAESEIIDKKEYLQTIVSLMEVELAFNHNQPWTGKVVNDFREFLRGGAEYKEMCTKDDKYENDILLPTSVDQQLLVNGHDFGNSAAEKNIQNISSTTSTLLNSNISIRNWKGLQYDCVDIPVNVVSVGRKGTPSGGYTHSFSHKLA